MKSKFFSWQLRDRTDANLNKLQTNPRSTTRRMADSLMEDNRVLPAHKHAARLDLVAIRACGDQRESGDRHALEGREAQSARRKYTAHVAHGLENACCHRGVAADQEPMAARAVPCRVRRPSAAADGAARLSCRLREGYSEAGDPGDPATSLARSSKSERSRRLASEAAEEQGRASQGGRISDRKSDPGESGWFCTDTPSLSAVAIPTRDRSRAPPPSPGTQLCVYERRYDATSASRETPREWRDREM